MEVIRELADTAEQSMRDAGLSSGYIETLSCTWRRFDRWLAERGLQYSPDLGDEFLADAYGVAGGDTTVGMGRRRRRALAVLGNCFEHKPYRRVEDRRYESKIRECHELVLREFLEDLARSFSDSTVCAYVYMLNKLSPYLADAGVEDLSDIGAADILGFMELVAKSGVGQQLVYATTGRLRRLLSWLGARGLVDGSLAGLVPKAKAPDREPPDTYTDEEVELIVDAIDTSGPTGKRNLVACLLAARLGMRSSDIVDLRFENLLWREGSISFRSAKTGTHTVLPLTNEVGGAIISYLRGGRPESGEAYVLLRHNPPHTRMRPSSVWGIVSAAMSRAGIAKDGRRRGPHALRASLATRMMRSGVPLPTITRALSHTCSETSRFYLKADVEQLRSCALDVPPLTNTWWIWGGSR